MSELKAYKMIDEKYCTDCLCVIPSDVYLKSEADKVIAELEDDSVCWKTMSQKNAADNEVMAKQRAEAFKRERHHKYKRCLAMAGWCEERCARYDLLQEHSGFSWRREIDFYFRWHCRWLDLAEKFKEAYNA